MVIGIITVLGVEFEVLLRPRRRPGLAGTAARVVDTSGVELPSEPPPAPSNVRQLRPATRASAAVFGATFSNPVSARIVDCPVCSRMVSLDDGRIPMHRMRTASGDDAETCPASRTQVRVHP